MKVNVTMAAEITNRMARERLSREPIASRYFSAWLAGAVIERETLHGHKANAVKALLRASDTKT